MKSIKVHIIGTPSTGKTIIANRLNAALKDLRINSVFVPEFAGEYADITGSPTHPFEQVLLINEQIRRENIHLGKKEYIICDYYAPIDYLYTKDAIVQYKKELEQLRTVALEGDTNLIDRFHWFSPAKEEYLLKYVHSRAVEAYHNADFVFFSPIQGEIFLDNTRYQEDELWRKEFEDKIKAFLFTENIRYVELIGGPAETERKIKQIITVLYNATGDTRLEAYFERNRKEMAVLGGRFSPPTNAHLQILELVENQLKVDKLMFLPVGDDYPDEGLIPIEHRMKMLREICKENYKWDISEIEANYKGKPSTYASLMELQKQYPNYNISFIMGSDNLKELSSWKDFEKLIRSFKIIVIQHDEDDARKIITEKYQLYQDRFIIVPELFHNGESSSVVRKIICEEQNFRTLVPASVYEYIKRNNIKFC
jgi:nicotinate-nucleotide adenylyltransferase